MKITHPIRFAFVSLVLISILNFKISFADVHFENAKPSISGISSGGFMAIQMATIFSSQFSAVGTVAGGFFYCAQNFMQEKIEEGVKSGLGSKNLLFFQGSSQFLGSLFDPFKSRGFTLNELLIPTPENPIYLSVGVCMGQPTKAALPNLQKMFEEGSIDSIENIRKMRLYIYHGDQDTVIKPAMANRIQEFYLKHGVELSKIKIKNGEGGHNFPTAKEGLNKCSAQEVPYLSSCKFDLAKEMLGHLLDRPLESSPIRFENLFVVDQNLDSRNLILTEDRWQQPSPSLAPYGYFYAPAECLDKPSSCHLHVALHGCKMSDSYDEAFDKKYLEQIGKFQILEMRKREELGFFGEKQLPYIEMKANRFGTLKFALNAGYLDYAEKNRVMILFPQTWITENNYPYNPKGCWDWFGWTGSNYASKAGAEAQWMSNFIKKIKESPKNYILPQRPYFEKIQ